MDTTNLIAYLPFDADATDDLCGNSWTASGTPVITDAALLLDGNSYIQTSGFTLGGQDFTLAANLNMPSNTPWYAVIFEATLSSGNNQRLEISRYKSESKLVVYANEAWGIAPAFDCPVGETFHFALVYQHDTATVKIFINGQLVTTVNKSLAAKNFTLTSIGQNTRGAAKWLGSIDEFMLFNGRAVWTEDFTPPTDDELFDLKMQFGHVHQSFAIATETELHNLPKGWRYHNAGDADLLEVDGSTLRGDYSKSVTGVCFNGGSTSQDCFNTPAGLKEVWIRFDIWTADGGTGADYRIGHYNSSTGKIIGVTREETWADYTPYNITSTAGNIYGTPNGISRCLLHIKSHATNGLCELTVNSTTIAKTGNINGGRDLDTLIIYAKNFGQCYFSNVIVSETPIMLDSGWHRDVIPAEAQITAPKLNVRLKGADVPIPLRTKRATGSVTVRVGNSNFYCPATATASLQAAVTFRLDDANHRLINSFG